VRVGVLSACCVALQSEPEPEAPFSTAPGLLFAWACCGRVVLRAVSYCSRGSMLHNLLRVDLLCRIAVGGDPRTPPTPLLRPASPMRFVIFLLGLQRHQLAPDLSSAQFIVIATKTTELGSVRTL
jgi:hypothetical protein